MGLYDYLMILRARLLVFVVVLFLAVDVSAVASVLATPKYTAKTTLFFSSSATAASNRDLTEGLLYAQTLVRSYAEAATQPLVLDPVIRQLDLRTTAPALARSVSAVSPLGTVIIEIRATDPSGRLSLAIAQAVANQLARSVDDLAPTRATREPPVRVTTVAAGLVSREPTSPRTLLNIRVALLWGLLAAVALCIWLESVDPRIRTRRDLALITDVPAVGYLLESRRRWPFVARLFGGSRRWHRQLNHLMANFGSLRESRKLRTVLFLAPKDGSRAQQAMYSVGILSEQAGATVLMVDAGLRVATDGGGPGLSAVLAGQADWRDCLVQNTRTEPPFLPGGAPLFDPSAALSSPAMAAFLEEARAEYDVVLLACPAVLSAADGAALATLVDGVFVVGDRKDTRRVVLERALHDLELVKAPVSGVILAS